MSWNSHKLVWNKCSLSSKRTPRKHFAIICNVNVSRFPPQTVSNARFKQLNLTTRLPVHRAELQRRCVQQLVPKCNNYINQQGRTTPRNTQNLRFYCGVVLRCNFLAKSIKKHSWLRARVNSLALAPRRLPWHVLEHHLWPWHGKLLMSFCNTTKPKSLRKVNSFGRHANSKVFFVFL